MRYLLLTALATALVFGGCKDDSNQFNPDASTDTDADTDTDTDTDADTDTDTDTDTDPVNPCPDGQYADCYGNDVWCHDSTGTPVTELDVCVGGELCVVLTSEVAECQCVPDSYTQCHNGDVWAYDSCGEFDELVLACESPASCKDISSTVADCCQSAAYEQCGTDENVHEFEACELTADVEEALIVDCPDNADCINDTSTTAICECRNEWYGTNCDQCPAHWDPDQDCGACAGYWSSPATNCDTCLGVGSDSTHCQCPSSDYFAQPGTEKCWTCPIPEASSGSACSTAGNVITWSSANVSCPTGFRLPDVYELAGLLDNCSVESWGIDCDPCDGSSLCNSWYPLYISAVWASDVCVGGHHALIFSNGNMFWTDCRSDTGLGNEKAICVH